MNSIIILLVISMLFLDAFSSVSNEVIVVVFLAGRVVAGGGWGPQEAVLQEVFDTGGSSKVQEVSSSVISYGRGRAAIVLGRSSTAEASHGGGQATAGQNYQCEGPGAGSC